jgi:hypothetical protein
MKPYHLCNSLMQKLQRREGDTRTRRVYQWSAAQKS